MGTQEQEQPPDQEIEAPDLPEEAEGYRPELVVKFEDDVDLPLEEEVDVGEYLMKHDLLDWDRLVHEYEGITAEPMFYSFDPEHLKRVVDEAVKRDPEGYRPVNFSSYLNIEFPPGTDPSILKEEARDLIQLSSVEWAYLGGRPGPPPDVYPPPVVYPYDDPRFGNQDYLLAAPAGINAKWCWDHFNPGGAGEQIRLVDVEQGWKLNHEDLPADIPLLWGYNRKYQDHGVAVLGIVVAADNTIGDVGIAPKASVSVVSEYKNAISNKKETARAIMKAIENKVIYGRLEEGDVLLLETQHFPQDGSPPWPIEAEKAVFDAIDNAVTNRIVAIEAAGNGNRKIEDWEDSGAIMVGAATSGVPHRWKSPSNYGERIDCYAWGENIDTLWTDNEGNKYTISFGKTSGAAAIVAGAALLVQSVRKAKWGTPYGDPKDLRNKLKQFGTPSQDGGAYPIGVMPNLCKIVGHLP